MKVDAPLIAPSARKHGIPDADMIHAFNHPMFVDDLDDGFTMFVGADAATNLLEMASSTPATARSSSTPCPPDPST